MEQSHKAIWKECMLVFKDNTTDQAFITWFKPIIPLKIEGTTLTIQVPSHFFYEFLENNYLNLITKTIKRVIGPEGTLRYSIPMDSSDPSYTMTLPGSNHNDTKNPLGRTPRESLSTGIVNPFVIPGLKKLQIDSQLNENYTFDNYVEGECNRLARQAGLQVAKSPGTTAFNPLLIYSGTGLGKTHLCHAIGNEVKRLHPDKIVLYVQAEQFLNQWATASKNNNQNDFVHFYQMIDVIIIDDIQFLAKKPSTQDVFFHIFNYLHQNNKQLVITSDKLPADLKDIAPRLLSRFKWGLISDLQMPDADTREAILKNRLYKDGIVFPDEITSYLATNVRTNIRELEGVLVSLVAQSSLNRKAITIDLAQKIIERFIRNSVKEISVEYIINIVCDYFTISAEQMALNTRKHQVVQARQIAMYLSKKYSNASLNAIGQQCGKKDHATVYHACKTVTNRLETDKQFKVMLADIEKKMAI